MEIQIISKPLFRVIGKLGQGLSNESTLWIKPLWEDANSNFAEIRHLAKLTEGKLAGIWGLMSDVGEQFKRWGTEGKYLAGCEVKADSEVPSGWTSWIVPTQTYVVATCSFETYGEAFDQVLNHYLPEKGYDVIGAIHEFYPPDAEQGLVQLYFPIAKD